MIHSSLFIVKIYSWELSNVPLSKLCSRYSQPSDCVICSHLYADHSLSPFDFSLFPRLCSDSYSTCWDTRILPCVPPWHVDHCALLGRISLTWESKKGSTYMCHDRILCPFTSCCHAFSVETWWHIFDTFYEVHRLNEICKCEIWKILTRNVYLLEYIHN